MDADTVSLMMMTSKRERWYIIKCMSKHLEEQQETSSWANQHGSLERRKTDEFLGNHTIPITKGSPLHTQTKGMEQEGFMTIFWIRQKDGTKKIIKETEEDIDGEWLKKTLDRNYKSMRVDDLK